ncbi:MAG: zinc transporter ZntB [Proteobacteria bacterium]|nr:zinc transporter ZntB [Pseudomonadota bacterium]MBU1739669.1 zinc transporter ZntB [Pseudomonadota bacterium]
MPEEKKLVIAFILDAKGGGRKIGWDEIRTWTPAEGILWCHMDYTDPETRAYLVGKSGIEDVVAELLLAEETRPRSTFFEEGLLVALRGVNLNPGADPEDMVSLRIWLEKNRIITTRKRELMSVQDIIHNLGKGKGPTSAAGFLADVAARLMMRMGDVIDEVEDEVAEIEETVLVAESHELRGLIATIRRKAISLRRYMAPQREALARLQTDELPWLGRKELIRLREVYDHMTRYIEDLDQARDGLTVTHEELLSRLSEQLNSRMYVLSLVAAIFLPLSFLTGLLGINIGGIPGADYHNAFIIFCVFLVAVVGGEILLFKKKNWL